jgi:hyperosmotically inducible periplasmic protein
MKRIILSLLCFLSLSFSLIANGQTTASPPAADNTARNERDRSGETKTADDQSNSSEDIKTTAAIRHAVVKDGSLSMMAKNVKIITANGVVTLRGPVKTQEEKARITRLAKSNAKASKIVNQLEVKTSK